MSKIVGICEDYSVSEEKKNSRGPYYLHFVTVDGVTYSCFGKKNKKNAARGDKIEFEWFKKNDHINFKPETFQVLERGAVKLPDVPSKDDQIMRQNAMRHAAAIVTANHTKKKGSEVDAVKLACNLAESIILPYIRDGVVPSIGENQ